MDTEWLVDFIAVIEAGSFTKAADRRNVSQPAFSRRIQSLENAVGVPLFERGIHKIQLTDAGVAFQPAAEEMLSQLANAIDLATSAADRKRNSIRFVCTHTLSFNFTPAWVQDLVKDFEVHPSVQITAHTMEECERSMRDGTTNFVIYHYHPDLVFNFGAGNTRSVDISQDALVLVGRPDLLDAARGHNALPYIEYSQDSSFSRIVGLAQADIPYALERSLQTTLAQAVVNAVNGGIGIAWCLQSLISDRLSQGELVKVIERELPLTIRLAMPRSRQNNAAENFWRMALRTTSKNLSQ